MTSTPVPFSASDISEMRAVPSTRVSWRGVMHGHTAKSISLAVGVHILAIIVVIISAMLSSSPRSHLLPPQATQPVRAVLYFPPSKIERPTENEAVTPLNEMPLQNEGEKVAIEDGQVANDAVTKPDNRTQPTSHAVVNAEKVTDEAREQASRNLAESSSVNAMQTSETQSNKQPIKTGIAVTDYFRNYNNEQLQEDAQQASSTFRKRKTSPVLIDPTYERDTKSDEQRIVKKVNCTSSTNKVLTLLSGFAGGTLKCTNMGSADKFIEKRVKKAPETESPKR